MSSNQVTSEELARIYSRGLLYEQPSATRPWGVAARRGGSKLESYGWYPARWQAEAVALHVAVLNEPIICRFYSRASLRNVAPALVKTAS